MPSTYSSNLRIELIASGEQANTWGITTNTNLGTLIEQAISGMATIDVTAGDVTLTALNGVSDQARQMILNVTGTPGVVREVVAPAVTKIYVVINGSNAAVTIVTTLDGDSVTIPPGVTKLVYSDGTGFFDADDTNILAASRAVVSNSSGVLAASPATATEVGYLSGVTSAIQTQINSKQATIGYTPVNKAGDTMTGDLVVDADMLATSYQETKIAPSISTNTLTLDCAAANVFAVSMTANINTLTFTNVPTSPIAFGLTLSCTADGTSRTISWGSSVKWPAGAPPALSSTNGKVDTFVLYTYDGGSNWYAFIAGQNA